jgi:non-heme chloroperoxidase
MPPCVGFASQRSGLALKKLPRSIQHLKLCNANQEFDMKIVVIGGTGLIGSAGLRSSRIDAGSAAVSSDAARGPQAQTRRSANMKDDLLFPSGASRRDVLVGALLATVAAGLPRAALAQAERGQGLTSSNATKGSTTMGMITTTKDGTEIYYKDWGPKDAQPIVFHHGWPLSGDDWDAQMLFFLQKGYRVVAHDRRGHGRSAQVSDGHDMDHYAADAAAVVEHLDLRNTVHVGHSTGGGEATRYVARHGQPQGRVAKLVLIGAVPPIMVKTPANPDGLPIEVFDGLRKSLAGNRAQFYLDFAGGPFYGFNRPGAKPIPGVIQNWWRQAMMGSAKAQYDGIKAFSETDFTEDLKAITVPTLVTHGDDDQIVPIADSALLSAKILKSGTLKVYEKFPHGMCTTHVDTVNPDLLAFISS